MTTVQLRTVNSCRGLLWTSRYIPVIPVSGSILVLCWLKHGCINPPHMYIFHFIHAVRLFPWSNCSAPRWIIMSKRVGGGGVFQWKVVSSSLTHSHSSTVQLCNWILFNYCNKDYRGAQWQRFHVTLARSCWLHWTFSARRFAFTRQSSLRHCTLHCFKWFLEIFSLFCWKKLYTFIVCIYLSFCNKRFSCCLIF